MRLAVLLGVVFAAACSRSAPTSETPAPAGDATETRSDAMTTSKDSDPAARIAVTPTAELRAWLDQQGERMLRLPMTLTLSGSGSVATATIGVNGEPDPIAVGLRDLAMGISLKDRLRKVCKPGGTCTVWLIGRWPGDGQTAFDVRKLDGEIAADQRAAATHAEVVAE